MCFKDFVHIINNYQIDAITAPKEHMKNYQKEKSVWESKIDTDSSNT